MAIGQFRVEIVQIGVGFDAVHATSADQAGKACPRTGTIIVTCKKSVAPCHCRASDRVFDQVGIHVDMTVLEEEAKAILSPEHVGESLASSDLRDTRSAWAL